MSETNKTMLSNELVLKLSYLSKKFKKLNTGNRSNEFWMVTDDPSEGYEWDQVDVGINEANQLIMCYQSGCSCNGPERPTADEKYELVKGLTTETDSWREYAEWPKLLEEMANTLYEMFKYRKFTTEAILNLPNAEIRRAAIEYIGLDKFLSKSNPEKLDESEWGKLVRIKVPEPDEDIVAVYVKDASTNRSYFLRVPPKTKTAKEGVAWTFGLNEEDYKPVKES